MRPLGRLARRRRPRSWSASVAWLAVVVVVGLGGGVGAAVATSATGPQGHARGGTHSGHRSTVSGQASISGLVTTSDSKTACIYVGWHGWGLAGVRALLVPAEQATGRVYNCLEMFSTANPQWSDWEDPWVVRPAYGYTEWIHRRRGRTVIFSTQLIPDAVSNRSDPLTWEQPCAAGQYDTYATTLAQHLVRAGFGHAVIRLGVEANGPWSNDFVGYTTQEQQAWGDCFASEVAAMRSVRGAHFLFVWNPNSCVQPLQLSNWYPGNASVDIIGIDQYDTLCSASSGSSPAPAGAARFKVMAAEPDGLDAVAYFAKMHHKPLALPEWGAVTQGSTAGSGAGDNAAYVRGIASFVAHHNVAFESYFDSANDSILPLTSADPNILSAYQAAFG